VISRQVDPADVPDCQQCGLCCRAPFRGDPWVDVQPEDDTPRHLTSVYTSEYDRRYAQRAMRQDRDGWCVALRRLDATGDDPRVCTCSIYERRPETCRLFRAGSAVCLALRRRGLGSTGPEAAGPRSDPRGFGNFL
jgi:Fe-S-cluster containining protein